MAIKEAVVELSEPIQVGTETLNTLKIHLPTVGDEEDAMDMAIFAGRPNNPVTLEICLFSKVTGVPYDKLRSMCNQDYAALRAAVTELSGGPRMPSQTANQES